MKRYIILSICLCLSAIPPLHAQVHFGIKAGLNISTADFDDSEVDPLTGFNAGVTSEIDFSDRLFLRPEVLYALKGWDFGQGTMKLHYINVPILAGYRPVSNFSVLFGPEFGYLLKPVRKPGGLLFTPPYEDVDYGIALGASYDVIRNLTAEMRYTYGFDTLIKAKGRDEFGRPTDEVLRDGANRVFQFSLIYFFRGEE